MTAGGGEVISGKELIEAERDRLAFRRDAMGTRLYIVGVGEYSSGAISVPCVAATWEYSPL
jgi:hypothetical protein